MIKQIFKQIWVERRQNGWLLIELAVVFFFLLLVTDLLWIKLKNYLEPKGFDIENTYVLKLKLLNSNATGYVNPELVTQTPVEKLAAIVERVRLYPDVESISISQYASPYSMGGYWDALKVDTLVSPSSLRCRIVTPSYFDVFRIRSADGSRMQAEETGYDQVVLTKDAAEFFYGDAAQAIGKEIRRADNEDNAYRVSQACNLLKRQEFMPYEKAYFVVYSLAQFKEKIPNLNVTSLDLCVRVKPGSKLHFEENFLSDMGDRLKENNLYVSSIVSSDKFRDNIVGRVIRQSITQMVYVMIFVLITVFMGVFGVFWLRTRQRQSEIGIRMAMGADKQAIWSSTLVESLCLVSLSILPGLLVYANLLYSDILDTKNLPFSLERVVLVFTVALLLMVLIVVGGTSWPANRAASIQPLDALRDE